MKSDIEQIESIVHKSIADSTQNISNTFDTIKQKIINDLIDSINIEIFNKLNKNKEDKEDKEIKFTADQVRSEMYKKISAFGHDTIYFIEKGIISNAINKIISARTLKPNEHYIYFTQNILSKLLVYHITSNYILHITLVTVTNYSNLCWFEFQVQFPHAGMDCATKYSQKNINDLFVTNYDYNTPINPIYIEMLQIINKFPAPIIYHNSIDKSISGNPHIYNMYYDENTPINYNRGCDNTIPNNANSQLLESIKQILESNKKNFIKNFVQTDNKCCMCFSYTDRKRSCIPCGHTQYCLNCIELLTKCVLCDTPIDQIIYD